MPRISARKKYLTKLYQHIQLRTKAAALRLLLAQKDISLEQESDILLYAHYNSTLSKRYMTRRTHRKSRARVAWNEYIDPISTKINDAEFLRLFRMSRRSFLLLKDELERTSVFDRRHRYKQPRPCFQQLLVYLYRVGRYGSSGSCHEVSLYFGIGSGTVRNYVLNVVTAIKELEPDVVRWPNQREKEAMKVRLASTGFRHCIGIADGTLIQLTTRPKQFHECYYCRKSFYALNTLIVCNDQGRIIYYYAGWPGSTHDNRVLRNSKLYSNREDYFAPLEYILGDSAYSSSSVMVQAFKKSRNEGTLPRDKEIFNTHLAKIRIKSEHCIGLLKGRFQCLKGMNTFIRHGKKDVKDIVDIISSCVILHNMLLNYEDAIPQEWYQDLLNDIDFSISDEIENIYTVDGVREEDVCRRTTVFHSIIENFA